eukprot:2609667-Alexandrium_andersonii.AAC.1
MDMDQRAPCQTERMVDDAGQGIATRIGARACAWVAPQPLTAPLLAPTHVLALALVLACAYHVLSKPMLGPRRSCLVKRPQKQTGAVK